MIINLPEDTLEVSSDTTLDNVSQLTTDRVKSYVYRTFSNETKYNTVAEVETAFKNVLMYHYMFVREIDTYNYANMLYRMLKMFIPSDIFEVVSVDFSILNCVLNGKTFMVSSRGSTSTETLRKEVNSEKYHEIGINVVDSSDRDTQYIGTFIINFKLNGTLRHCIVNLIANDYGERYAQPEIMNMSQEEYDDYMTKLNAVLEKYPKYKITSNLKEYSESMFLG